MYSILAGTSHGKEVKNMSKINYQDFIKVKTPEKAYLLGFIWSDGWLRNASSKTYSVGIEIVSEDMIKLKPIFDKSCVWRECSRHRPNRRPQTCCSFTNRQIHKFLVKCDYLEKSIKSADKILKIIPMRLRKYFYRGVFDGDGCFYHGKTNCSQMSVAGSYNQNWKYWIQLFNQLGVKYQIKRREQKQKGKIHRSSIIRITNKLDIVKFGQYLYGNSFDGIGLQRKYDKYQVIYHRLLQSPRQINKQFVSTMICSSHVN